MFSIFLEILGGGSGNSSTAATGDGGGKISGEGEATTSQSQPMAVDWRKLTVKENWCLVVFCWLAGCSCNDFATLDIKLNLGTR